METSSQNRSQNAAALNNLAIHLGTIALQTRQTRGIQEAFRALDKAIQLNPKEPLYRHNFATLLCSFRQPAARYYKIKPQQIPRKPLANMTQPSNCLPKNSSTPPIGREAFLDLTPFLTPKPYALGRRHWPLLKLLMNETGPTCKPPSPISKANNGNTLLAL